MYRSAPWWLACYKSVKEAIKPVKVDGFPRADEWIGLIFDLLNRGIHFSVGPISRFFNYAVVFASSVAILVKFVGSFNIYVTTIESVGSVAFDSLLPWSFVY